VNKRCYYPILLVSACFAVVACSSTTVRTTEQTKIVTQGLEQTPEEQLLDVGVNLFDPGFDPAAEQEQVFPDVRRAEARYMPNILATTLQNTGSWGAVRIIPHRQSEADLWVDGEILVSDGSVLKLRVTVQDSTGTVWFTRDYEEFASKYAYDKNSLHMSEPFQGLYNRIANDMLAYRNKIDPERVDEIRKITELKFARRFSPEAFADFVTTDDQGHHVITRLPARNDPLLQRISRIRERDYLFVDTMQDYYQAYFRHMEEAYFQWRFASYKETEELNKIKADAKKRIAGGIFAAVAGIAVNAATSDSSSSAARTVGDAAGVIGIGAGAVLIKSGLDKGSEAKMQVETLREIAASLDAEIEPHSVALEDQTVTLSGTVEQQYDQWREILRQIYIAETGNIAAAPISAP